MGQTRPWRHVGVESVLSPTSDIGRRRRHGSFVPKPVVSGRSNRCSYSITSSARASSVGGISMLRALAVLRLMTSSNLVGC
jgi:hypothetical protein